MFLYTYKIAHVSLACSVIVCGFLEHAKRTLYWERYICRVRGVVTQLVFTCIITTYSTASLGIYLRTHLSLQGSTARTRVHKNKQYYKAWYVNKQGVYFGYI